MTVNQPAVCANFMQLMRPRTDKMAPRFLHLYLNHFHDRGGTLEWQTATTNIRNIKASEYVNLLTPMPSLAEQQRIVEIVEDHLSHLDAADRDMRTAEARSKALVKSILTCLIPPTEGYPSSWEVRSTAGAGRIDLGRQRHPDWHTGPNMHPYLRVANVFEDRIDVSDIKEMHWPDGTFDRFQLRPGDVLLNEGQSPEFLGRPAIYRGELAEVAFTNSLLRFRAFPDVLPEFALLVFRRHMHAGRFKRESRITTNIAHLSASRLKGIEFPVPGLDEQQSMVDTARDRLASVTHLQSAMHAHNVRGSALRRAVLAAAFAGRLTGASTDSEIIEEMAQA